MPARPVQNPIREAGRRAASSGLGVEACPYPGWMASAHEWLAGWDEGGGGTVPLIRAGTPLKIGAYRPEETARIEAMLADGHTAVEIARALHRDLHSVEVKIGAMRRVDREMWTPALDAELIRLRRGGVDRPPEEVSAIAKKLGRSERGIWSRLAYLGIRVAASRNGKSAATLARYAQAEKREGAA
jgi:hypothetical protein